MEKQFCPEADDIDLEDYGDYPREELVKARESLLQTVLYDQSAVWNRIRDKLGVQPDGRQLDLPSYEPDFATWPPDPIPKHWSAPVRLFNRRTLGSEDAKKQEFGAENGHAEENEKKVLWGSGAVVGLGAFTSASRSRSTSTATSTTSGNGSEFAKPLLVLVVLSHLYCHSHRNLL